MAYAPSRTASAPSQGNAGTLHSFNAVGLAESISDIVSMISPADTPCFSTFRKESALQAVHSWQEDKLRAPKRHVVIEGADAGAGTHSVTGLKQNYTQLFEEVAKVSSTVRSSQAVGRGDEMEYQIMKRGKEIKRDIERSFVGIDLAAAAGNASTARTMASLSQLIDSSLRFDAGAGTGTNTNNLEETDILTAQQALYAEGGDANWLLCNANDSMRIANFAYISPVASGVRSREVDEGTLYNKVETYISPFGTLSVVIDRFVGGSPGVPDATNNAPAHGDGLCFLLDTERCFVPELQPMSTIPLAKVGHSDQEMVFCELTLGLENSFSSAVITDLNISTVA